VFALFKGIGGLVYMLGLLVLGIAIVRSKVFPGWAGALMAVAPLLLLLPVPENPVLTGLIIEVPRGLAVAASEWTLLVGGGREPRVARAPLEGAT
jgi:hypothetical protein